MITRDEAKDRYGIITNTYWANEPLWCRGVNVPKELAHGWINSSTRDRLNRIYCNKDMAEPLTKALNNIKDRKLISELKTFDGCYCVRNIRGSNDLLSAHAYAMALDINAATNPLGGPNNFTPEFVNCFTDEGFKWGGEFSRTDPMHFSLLGW